MNNKPKNFWRHSRRPGLTLVECLVAMVILGVILSSVLMARARYIHQAALARRQVQAVAAADELLNHWEQESAGPPRQAQGQVEGANQLLWRTHLVENSTVASLGAQVLRLEVFDGRPAGSVSPLASVDLIVPHPPQQPASAPSVRQDRAGAQ